MFYQGGDCSSYLVVLRKAKIAYLNYRTIISRVKVPIRSSENEISEY